MEGIYHKLKKTGKELSFASFLSIFWTNIKKIELKNILTL